MLSTFNLPMPVSLTKTSIFVEVGVPLTSIALLSATTVGTRV